MIISVAQKNVPSTLLNRIIRVVAFQEILKKNLLPVQNPYFGQPLLLFLRYSTPLKLLILIRIQGLSLSQGLL